MIKVGITGTIGSGKSTISRIFNSLGIPVYNSDSEAKKLYKDENVKAVLRETFGSRVFGYDNEIDLEMLAGLIFSNTKALETVNSIIHPLVKKSFNKWFDEQYSAVYVLYESALLFESGFYKDYHYIINVSAPRTVCIERIVKNKTLGREQVIARMDRQLTDVQKSKLADYIIINDGKHLVIPQVIKLHEDLLYLSDNHPIDF